MNNTLSIDLTRPWTTSDVEFRVIPKSTPGRNRQTLWRESDGFTSWGGSYAYGRFPSPLDREVYYRFRALPDGSGTWSKESPSNPATLSALHIHEDAACTTVRDTGFCVGGNMHGWTEKTMERDDIQAIPGVMSFNMTTRAFSNDTAGRWQQYKPETSPHGTVVAGEAEYVPNFGPNGLVFVLGGASYSLNPADRWDGKPQSLNDLSVVHFFDPVTGQWFTQTTTGTVPERREGFCMVGAQSQSGSFELWVSPFLFSLV